MVSYLTFELFDSIEYSSSSSTLTKILKMLNLSILRTHTTLLNINLLYLICFFSSHPTKTVKHQSMQESQISHLQLLNLA